MSNLKLKICCDWAVFTSLRKDNNFLWLPCYILLLFQFSNEERGLADLDGDGGDGVVWKPQSNSIQQRLSSCLASESGWDHHYWTTALQLWGLSSVRDRHNVSSRAETVFRSHCKIWAFSKLIDTLIYQDTKAPFFFFFKERKGICYKQCEQEFSTLWNN